jgi:ribosomal protein S18 acetylase RimI-like enzyme
MPYSVRDLPVDEWAKVQPHFVEQGVALPSREHAKILVEEDGDRIVAFLVVQFVPHLEPVWVDPEYRGRTHFGRLVQEAITYLAGGAYYAFVPNDREDVADMARLSGLTKKDWTIFEGQVN